MHTSSRRITFRYLRVLVFFGALASNVLFWDVFLRKIGLRALAMRSAGRRYRRSAGKFRRLATRLGGIWIKVGQFLSARADVLPRSITDELAGLQDEVKPEKFDTLRAVLDQEFAGHMQDLFSWVDPDPLASASLGQVHRARLADGKHVVVKIQRPGIRELIAIDLRALKVVIGWMKHVRAITRRADLDALFEEFSRTVWQEVDYLAEAENAKRFRSIFADDPGVRIPRVFADQTTERVITLEDVYFIKITDYAAIEAAGIDRGEVASRLFNTYLHQIFEIGFFHADPHPGNLFVEPKQDGKWNLVFVDFGMVGHLRPKAKEGMRELAIAIARKDAQKLVAAYQTLDMLLPNADLERIRQAEAMFLDRVWGLSMQELSSVRFSEMREFAEQYRELLYELPFQLPADMIFLGRCIGILSGMCTGLNPKFNFFSNLMPFARHLIGSEEDIFEEVLEWLMKQAQMLAGIPGRLDNVLQQIEHGKLVVVAQPSASLQRQLSSLTRAVNQLAGTVIFLGLLLTGTFLYSNDDEIFGGALLIASLIVALLTLRRK
ncbi:MAG: AarF/ABC1/UbiB kinase family protein [Chloroflexi bacterium]|nr:AarF/ABC1/UbiB kinase family protein [Chloroflexota bacterium]